MAKKRKKSKKGSFWGFVALGFLLLILGFGGWKVFQNRYAIRGIDVSHYQGEIKWEKVKKADVAFAFVKATEGISLVDAQYERNRAQTTEIKLPFGAYHFFRPSLSGKQQAKHFLKTYKPLKGDLPPVLDLEETDGQSAKKIRKEALAWLKAVEKSTGVKPIVYTLPHFASSYLNGALSEYPLWVVDLGWREPADSKGWKSWTFWQHKHTGRVSGIKGDVDLNYFNGNLVDFERLRRQ